VIARSELAAGALVALGIAGTALAVTRLVQGPAPRHPVPSYRLLQTLDADGSGFLEPRELDGRDPPGQVWSAHDLDGDGRLDVRELEIAMDALDPRWLLRLPE
jgi:hypothetical protein